MHHIPQNELEQVYDFAVQLGEDAGKILLDGIVTRRLIGDNDDDAVEKLNAVDIVTKTDNGEWN